MQRVVQRQVLGFGVTQQEPSQRTNSLRAQRSVVFKASAGLGPLWLKGTLRNTKRGAPRSSLRSEHGIGDIA